MIGPYFWENSEMNDKIGREKDWKCLHKFQRGSVCHNMQMSFAHEEEEEEEE